MRKTGFTLAEVLITLGIIGVVAAITIPTLTNNVKDKEVGPKLAKAVAAFEQANLALLNDKNVSSLTNTGIEYVGNSNAFGPELEKYLIMAPVLGNKINYEIQTGKCSLGQDGIGEFYITKDGMAYMIQNITAQQPENSLFRNPKNVRLGRIIIDVNGASKPNVIGTDAFEFHWMNDGSLIPYGSTTAVAQGLSPSCNWEDDCKKGESPKDYRACAGHIFDNNLEILYR